MRFSEAHLPQLVSFAADWVRRVHADQNGRGEPLPDLLVRAYTPFIPAATVARIRVSFVEEIPNPDFYPSLQKQGFDLPLDFGKMDGLTLIDTVLVSRKRADLTDLALASLLFHEAVHVVQYEYLGVERFMNEYVFGWASAGYEYGGIPLEVQAYSLESRFRTAPFSPFSVPEAVASAFPSSTPAA